jgi:phosphomannomutase
MASLRADPPEAIAGEELVGVLDLSQGAVWQPGLPPLPPADVLCYKLASGSRLIVRPSGTEAKLKSYLEVLAPTSAGLAEARLQCGAEMSRLEQAAWQLLGGER